MPAPTRPWQSGLLLCPIVGLLACQGTPDDLREWRPSDHTNAATNAVTASSNRPRQSAGEEGTTVPGLDQVTLASWRSNCVVCHGSLGRGDGPQAPMFKPRDLADPEWQASVSDEQIREVIQKGRNRMPGFALPEQVADNLVRLVRLLGGLGSGAKATPSTPAPQAPPSSSASVPPPASTPGRSAHGAGGAGAIP